MPTAPASLLQGERGQDPGNSAAGMLDAYGSTVNALRRANQKLAGWQILWFCTAQALASGTTGDMCTNLAVKAAAAATGKP